MGILKRLFGKPTLNKYGWRPDVPDHRDYKFSRRITTIVETPEVVDLRPKMPNVYNQKDLGSCHDAATEVLTSQGWVPFPHLTTEHKLATVDPVSSSLYFEYPTRVVRLPWSGLMYRGAHQNLDFLVTPDHQMLVRKWVEADRTLSDTYDFVSMKDVGWYTGLLASAASVGQAREFYTLPGVVEEHKPQRESVDIPMDLWLMFLGIYLAEGTMLKQKKSEMYKIQIAGVKEREKAFIRMVLSGMGQHYTELSDRFTLNNQRLYSALKELGLQGVKAPHKFVPEFVFSLPGESLKSLLLGHFMGDGTEQNGIKSHYTSSRRLADDLQRLILLSGGWGSLRSRGPRSSTMKDGRTLRGNYPEYRVSQWTTSNLSIGRKADITPEFYDGMVYCAEVPTYHTLVTRRNDKVLISGNCTSNAIGAAFQYVQIKSGQPNWVPSRLMIYYMEREMENTVNEDAGAQIRDGIKVLAKYGVAPEELWPYNVAKFTKKPPASVYKVASYHQALTYARVDQTEAAMEQCLAQGFPIVFGFAVYSSFETQAVAKTGLMPIPAKQEKDLGGHAVLIVGYNRVKRHFIVRNSWGPDWGDKGYFYMPYAYALDANLCDDFWAIYTVEDEDGK